MCFNLFRLSEILVRISQNQCQSYFLTKDFLKCLSKENGRSLHQSHSRLQKLSQLREAVITDGDIASILAIAAHSWILWPFAQGINFRTSLNCSLSR